MSSMRDFKFQVRTPDDQVHTGVVQATDVRSAMDHLEAQGFTVLSIRDCATDADMSEGPHSQRGSSAPDAPFTEAAFQAIQTQWQRVLGQSSTLVQVMNVYVQELPAGRDRRELQSIIAHLESQERSDELLAPARFEFKWLPLLSAAAATEDPDYIVSGMLRERKQHATTTRRALLVLLYPLVVMTLTALIVLGFSKIVIPVFSEIYQDFGVELPASTACVLWLGKVVDDSHGMVLFAPLAGIPICWVFARLVLSTTARDRWLDLVPIIGRLRRSLYQARFTRSMADLLIADVPVPDALLIAGCGVNQITLRNAATELSSSLQRDDTRIDSVAVSDVPNTVRFVLQQAASGEVSGILHEISDGFYDRAADEVNGFVGLVEPILMLIVGGGVALMFVSMFLPLFRLISALT